MPIELATAHFDSAALGRDLGGVEQQVQQDLDEQFAVRECAVLRTVVRKLHSVPTTFAIDEGEHFQHGFLQADGAELGIVRSP